MYCVEIIRRIRELCCDHFAIDEPVIIRVNVGRMLLFHTATRATRTRASYSNSYINYA